MIDADNSIHMDDPTRFVVAPDLVPNSLYDKNLFYLKLTELGVNGPLTEQVMASLGDQFTLDNLEQTIATANRSRWAEVRADAHTMVVLAARTTRSSSGMN